MRPNPKTAADLRRLAARHLRQHEEEEAARDSHLLHLAVAVPEDRATGAVVDDSPSPETAYLAAEDVQRIRTAFARLSSFDQRLLRMNVTEGLSAREIGIALGEITGVKRSTRTWEDAVLAAKRRLRILFDATEED